MQTAETTQTLNANANIRHNKARSNDQAKVTISKGVWIFSAICIH